jgi:hypothetical protein
MHRHFNVGGRTINERVIAFGSALAENGVAQDVRDANIRKVQGP